MSNDQMTHFFTTSLTNLMWSDIFNFQFFYNLIKIWNHNTEAECFDVCVFETHPSSHNAFPKPLFSFLVFKNLFTLNLQLPPQPRFTKPNPHTHETKPALLSSIVKNQNPLSPFNVQTQTPFTSTEKPFLLLMFKPQTPFTSSEKPFPQTPFSF